MRELAHMTLLEWIENYLKEKQISATRFGRMAVCDPRFVLDLRNGRQPRRKTVARLESYIGNLDAGCEYPRRCENAPTDNPCKTHRRTVGNGNSNAAPIALQSRVAGSLARRTEAAGRGGGEGEGR